MNFMVDVPEASPPAIEICWRRRRRRGMMLGGRDVVVVDEGLEAVDVLVVVHQLRDGVDELDDGLGADGSRGGLRTEDVNTRLGVSSVQVILHAEVRSRT